MINTVNKEAENVDDFMYEAAWRLADWNIVDPHRVADGATDASANLQSVRSDDYHASHYRALKCLSDGDTVSLKSALDSGRASIVRSLRNISLGNFFLYMTSNVNSKKCIDNKYVTIFFRMQSNSLSDTFEIAIAPRDRGIRDDRDR